MSNFEFKVGDRVQVVREPADPQWYRQFDVGTVVRTFAPGVYDVDFGPYHWRKTRNGDALWAVNGDVLELLPPDYEDYE